ncbi:MAG TPA: gamma-glutamylcyclotransferase [Hyphomicrobium sp.]|jgi:cation transport protein ChaC
MSDKRDLWVFAYGSLMWRPGFPFEEVAHARLTGWSRAFCIYSRFHRGSPRRPGLVLGLDRGGLCEGMAFRVGAEAASATLAYLREREQIISVYREALVPVTLLKAGHPEVMALTFLVERAHPSYAGRLPLTEQACLIRGAAGLSGGNIDYLANTVAHLRELGIRERGMERLMSLVGVHVTRCAADGHVRPGALAMMREWCKRPVRVRRSLRSEDARRFSYRATLGTR